MPGSSASDDSSTATAAGASNLTLLANKRQRGADSGIGPADLRAALLYASPRKPSLPKTGDSDRIVESD